MGKGGVPHWSLAVLNTKPDGRRDILAANMFNDPPRHGHQFFMVELEATYLGPDSVHFWLEFSLKAVGQSGVVYTASQHSCGVTPDEFPAFTELFAGGKIKGWQCWEVPSNDADSLKLLLDSAFGDARFWFNLR